MVQLSTNSKKTRSDAGDTTISIPQGLYLGNTVISDLAHFMCVTGSSSYICRLHYSDYSVVCAKK